MHTPWRPGSVDVLFLCAMAERGWRVFSTAILTVVLALLLALGVARAASSAPATGSIVFSAHPEGTGAAQLFRVDPAGTGLAQITTGSLPATAPAFSPDGKHLVFVRLGSGIFRVDLDGTGLHRLTSGKRDNHPAWSPDGRRIAFLRPVRKEWRVYMMPSSDGRQIRLPDAPPAGKPTWTANGKSLYVPAAGDLVRIDARTGKILKFYGLALDVQTGQTATVSPNGSKVAFIGPRISTGPPDCGEGPCPQYGLYLANLRKPHRQRRIVNDTGPAGWSPNGASIVFVSRGALVLRVVATGATTSIAVGSHVAAGDTAPAWQPG